MFFSDNLVDNLYSKEQKHVIQAGSIKRSVLIQALGAH